MARCPTSEFSPLGPVAELSASNPAAQFDALNLNVELLCPVPLPPPVFGLALLTLTEPQLLALTEPQLLALVEA